MDRELREACRDAARASRFEVEVKEFWYFAPTAFDKDCVAAVKRAAEAQGFPAMDIISGAGHDAVVHGARRAHGDGLRALCRRHQP